MSGRYAVVGSFAAGVLLAGSLAFLMGADQPVEQSRRYDVDIDFVAGGMGGMIIEVTDHAEQKTFVYQHSKQGELPRLAATIDLMSVGKPQLGYQEIKKKEPTE